MPSKASCGLMSHNHVIEQRNVLSQWRASKRIKTTTSRQVCEVPAADRASDGPG